MCGWMESERSTKTTRRSSAGTDRGIRSPQPASRRCSTVSRRRWWIVGGWAIDAFTGRPREHHDIDVGFFRADLGAMLDHLAPTVCVWSNASGTLRPLTNADDLLPDCRQLWVRRDGASPWILDFAMTPHDGDDLDLAARRDDPPADR